MIVVMKQSVLYLCVNMTWHALIFHICVALFAFSSNVNAKPLDASTNCGYQSCNNVKSDVLNVHIVSHSHDDVGWLKTVEQYYDGSNVTLQNANVSKIITSVVESLKDHPYRRFIQVETFFFHKWWQQQNDETKQLVHKLVENGQFEFTGGGWSMNDEAATDFHSIIDQFTFGLKFLNETFGACARPKIGWQIDPFGHSSEMASIFAQMGYDGVFFPRIDWRDKAERLNKGTMEMIWQGSRSLSEESNIFTSVMFNHYNAPEGFCFDVTCHDDSINTDPKNPKYNYESKVKKYANVITDAAKYYKTNNLLVTMGGDFNYMDAETYYKNLDALIKGFSLWPQTFQGQPINIFYSTPACYVKAVNDVINAEKIELPLETNDFFPYATDYQTYWTGYYTSRPASKRSARNALNLLQVHKQLATFTQTTNSSELFELQNAVGIMQHHDAITGTEKQHVADDYARILHNAFLDSGAKINDHISKLLNKDQSNPIQLNLKQCLLKNATICPDSQSSEFTVVLYNPGSTKVKHPARIPVHNLDFEITDPSGEKIKYQLVPSIAYVEGVSAKYELTFIAELPPMGIKVYHIVRATVVRFLLEEDNSDAKFDLGGFTIDPTTGLLDTVTINNVGVKMQQELMYYNSEQDFGRNSGAYVFRNRGDAVPIKTNPVSVTTYKGELFNEVHQVYSDWAKQVIRIYKDAELADMVEFDWLVGPIPIEDKQGKEVITRFTSNLTTDADFFTDSNGRDMVHRVRDQRPNYKYTNEEPTTGNYYPVTSQVTITDAKVRMSVLNDRAQGGSSLKSGQLELMVHRRPLRDDYWGVGEALNEKENGAGLKVRGRHYLTLTPVEIQGIERNLADKIAFNPWMFIDNSTKIDTINKAFDLEFAGVKDNEKLPEMVRVLTLEPMPEEENTVLLRLENYFDMDSGSPQTVSVKNLFSNFEVVALEEMNLAGNIPMSAMERLSWHNYDYENEKRVDSMEVTLNPMQIKTFIARVKYFN